MPYIKLEFHHSWVTLTYFTAKNGCNVIFLHLWPQKLYGAFRFGTLWPISCSYPRHSQLTRHSLMLANGRIRQSLTALVNHCLRYPLIQTFMHSNVLMLIAVLWLFRPCHFYLNWWLFIKINTYILTQRGLVMPYGNIDAGQHLFSYWLVRQHQWPLLLTWFNFNPSMDK